jgi:fatty acid desaturase
LTRQRPSDPSASRHGSRHLRTPTEQLSRPDKLMREAMHVKVLTGLLLLALVAGCFVASSTLDVWHEWLVLGMIFLTGIGAIIAVAPTRRA